MNIQCFKPGTDEYSRLSKACEEFNRQSPNHLNYRVEDCYFDFGQDMMWTTIVTTTPWGTDVQVLSPRDMESIILLPKSAIPDIVAECLDDKYSCDKRKDTIESSTSVYGSIHGVNISNIDEWISDYYDSISIAEISQMSGISEYDLQSEIDESAERYSYQVVDYLSVNQDYKDMLSKFDNIALVIDASGSSRLVQMKGKRLVDVTEDVVDMINLEFAM